MSDLNPLKINKLELFWIEVPRSMISWFPASNIGDFIGLVAAYETIH